MEPYLKLAEKYDYKVVSLIVENRHGNKSVHNVPDETMEKNENMKPSDKVLYLIRGLP